MVAISTFTLAEVIRSLTPHEKILLVRDQPGCTRCVIQCGDFHATIGVLDSSAKAYRGDLLATVIHRTLTEMRRAIAEKG